MKRFYNLLIVDNLNIDDLGTMHKENRQDVKEIRKRRSIYRSQSRPRL